MADVNYKERITSVKQNENLKHGHDFFFFVNIHKVVGNTIYTVQQAGQLTPNNNGNNKSKHRPITRLNLKKGNVEGTPKQRLIHTN